MYYVLFECLVLGEVRRRHQTLGLQTFDYRVYHHLNKPVIRLFSCFMELLQSEHKTGIIENFAPKGDCVTQLIAN